MHLLRELFRRRMSHLLHLHRAFIPWRGCDVKGQCIPGRSGQLKGRKVAGCGELHFPGKKLQDHLPLGWISSRRAGLCHDPNMA